MVGRKSNHNVASRMPPCYHLGLSKQLQEMLAVYRKARDAVERNPHCQARGNLMSAASFQVCEHLLTLDASDLDKRDSEKPAAPSEGHVRCLECGSTDRIPKALEEYREGDPRDPVADPRSGDVWEDQAGYTIVVSEVASERLVVVSGNGKSLSMLRANWAEALDGLALTKRGT